MRVFKALLFIVFITLVALIYVHQQVELVKLSYAIGCKDKKIKEMLDYNEALGYNIENLEDPSRLEKILTAKNIDLAMPRPGNVVRVAKANPGKAHEDLRMIGLDKKLNILSFLEFFSSKAEAQTSKR